MTEARRCQSGVVSASSLELTLNTGEKRLYALNSTDQTLAMTLESLVPPQTYVMAHNVSDASFVSDGKTITMTITVNVNGNQLLVNGSAMPRRTVFTNNPLIRLCAGLQSGDEVFLRRVRCEEFPTQTRSLGSISSCVHPSVRQQALKAMQQMMNDPKNAEQSELLEQLLQEGMLDKDGKGKLRLTPKPSDACSARR